MSNQCMVDVRHFNDEVLVLVEDNYGKTFRSYDVEYFDFETVLDLLDEVEEYSEMDGAFWVEKDENDNPLKVVCETCSSLEVYGFDPDEYKTDLIVTKEI